MILEGVGEVLEFEEILVVFEVFFKVFFVLVILLVFS